MRPQPGAGFSWVDAHWGPMLQCAVLGQVAAHCFTSRSLRLEPADDRGWAAIAREVGVQPGALVQVRQVHGADVLTIERGQALPRVGEQLQADIIVSDDPAVALAVRAADCVPLLMADPVSGAAAAGHAGWRGTASRVAHRMVDTLRSAFGVRPTDLVAAVGPCIGPCCYEVGEELIEVFEQRGHGTAATGRWFQRVDGRYRLDLWQATRDALEDADVISQRIFVAGLCTASHRDWFWSYRAEGAGTGRQAGVVRPPGRPNT